MAPILSTNPGTQALSEGSAQAHGNVAVATRGLRPRIPLGLQCGPRGPLYMRAAAAEEEQ